MNFEVGQKVVIFDRHNGDHFSEVVRVTKRFVETKGGGQWNPSDGHPYPYQQWGTSHIVPVVDVTAEELERVRRMALARYMRRRVKWDEVPLSTLEEIAGLLSEAKDYGYELDGGS